MCAETPAGLCCPSGNSLLTGCTSELLLATQAPAPLLQEDFPLSSTHRCPVVSTLLYLGCFPHQTGGSVVLFASTSPDKKAQEMPVGALQPGLFHSGAG